MSNGRSQLPAWIYTRSPPEKNGQADMSFLESRFPAPPFPFRIPHIPSQPRAGQQSLPHISTTNLSVDACNRPQSAVVRKLPPARLRKYRYTSISSLPTIPSASVHSSSMSYQWNHNVCEYTLLLPVTEMPFLARYIDLPSGSRPSLPGLRQTECRLCSDARPRDA